MTAHQPQPKFLKSLWGTVQTLGPKLKVRVLNAEFLNGREREGFQCSIANSAV